MFWGLIKKGREELGKSKAAARHLSPSPLLLSPPPPQHHLPLKPLSGGSGDNSQNRVFVPCEYMVISVRDVGSHKIEGWNAPLRAFISLKDLWKKHFLYQNQHTTL